MQGLHSDADEDLWVYHEKQMSSLCGQHCINNLVQGASYSAADLAEIAHELDEKERNHMLAEGATTPDALRFLAEDSGNVDAAGNFSIQVLSTALTRLYGLHLVSAGSETIGGKISTTGFAGEEAFVLNRHAHWVAIRSIGGVYWDLNSTLDSPARITTFALEATLHQLREDGYSVFVVRGNGMPPPARMPREGSRESWYRLKELVEASKGGRGSGKPLATAATDVWLNSGPGQRLDGQTATSAGGASGSPSGGAAKSEDELLAMALSASMEGGETGGEGTEEGGGAKGDEVARAIALSLEAESPDIYKPKPKPESRPAGPDIVRIQLRVGENKKIVHSFSRSDPVSALADVAAHALAEADGQAVTAPFDLVAPGGRQLLKAGRFPDEAGQREEGEGDGQGPTIGSEQLGGASVLVRRSR